MDNQVNSYFVYDVGFKYLIEEMSLDDGTKLEIDVSTFVEPKFPMPDNTMRLIEELVVEENESNLPYLYNAEAEENAFSVTCIIWVNKDAEHKYKEIVKSALMTGVACLSKRILSRLMMETDTLNERRFAYVAEN